MMKMILLFLVSLVLLQACNEDDDSCYCNRCCTDQEYYNNNPDYCYENCGSFQDDCGCK